MGAWARPRSALVPAGRLEEWYGLLFIATDARSGGGDESAECDGAGSDKVGVRDSDGHENEAKKSTSNAR